MTETIRQMNVLILDDSKEINDLSDWDGSRVDIQKSHIIIHRGRVLKNAYGSKYKGFDGHKEHLQVG